MVGSLAGRTPADRAFAQFLLGPVVGLLLNVDLDQLPSHLVTQCPGDGFQLRELGASRKTFGIEFSREFPSDSAQARVEFLRISAASLPIFASLSKLRIEVE